jgi:ABC-type multidrug transport system fused ATPase/permease subunit
VRQAAARVFEVTDAPVPAPEPEAPLRLPAGPVSLEARSVWARYPGAPSAALRGVDLRLSPGRRVAIVGPSGAGKSTLGSVLLGFLPIESGSLTLDRTPIDRLAGDDRRAVIGLVGQDAYLFETTIAENLRVGSRRAPDDQLRRVLDRVGLSGWLEELPSGLSTEVGRQGSRLSGGQRQRVAVARALLADFPILVLDEPTEHLDVAAAEALTADLLTATEGCSVALITHRLTGLERVDEILFMEAGRVVERGDHHALIERRGRYWSAWREGTRGERSVTSNGNASRPVPSALASAAPGRALIDRSVRP